MKPQGNGHSTTWTDLGRATPSALTRQRSGGSKTGAPASAPPPTRRHATARTRTSGGTRRHHDGYDGGVVPHSHRRGHWFDPSIAHSRTAWSEALSRASGQAVRRSRGSSRSISGARDDGTRVPIMPVSPARQTQARRRGVLTRRYDDGEEAASSSASASSPSGIWHRWR